MSTAVVPLQDLAQRISQQQAELVRLRRQFEARQRQVQKLTERKQQLQTLLQQVEAEIMGIAQGQVLPTKPVPTKTASGVPESSVTAPVSLPKLLVEIVSEEKQPITIKELANEVVRRKYPSTSANLADIVDTRVHELVKKGLLRRAPNQAGVLPGVAQPATKVPSPNSVGSSKPVAPRQEASTQMVAPASELTLSAAVTKALAASSKPLTARELADAVLTLGYQSKSKDFTNVIWSGIGKMENIEHVKGLGYRLKKGKASPSTNKGTGSK